VGEYDPSLAQRGKYCWFAPEECLFDFSAAKYSPVHFFISDEQSEEHNKSRL